MKKIALALAGISMCFGCATVRSPVGGLFYTETKGPEQATGAKLGQERGEACATSILGIVATGDASITAAAASAGIAKVTHVDSSAFSILGVYSKFCTIAYGMRGKGRKKPAPSPKEVPAEGSSEEAEEL